MLQPSSWADVRVRGGSKWEEPTPLQEKRPSCREGPGKDRGRTREGPGKDRGSSYIKSWASIRDDCAGILVFFSVFLNFHSLDPKKLEKTIFVGKSDFNSAGVGCDFL